MSSVSVPLFGGDTFVPPDISILQASAAAAQASAALQDASSAQASAALQDAYSAQDKRIAVNPIGSDSFYTQRTLSEIVSIVQLLDVKMNGLDAKMDAFLNSIPAANNTKGYGYGYGYAEGKVSENNTNVSENNTNANAQEGGRRKSRRKSRKNRA